MKPLITILIFILAAAGWYWQHQSQRQMALDEAHRAAAVAMQALERVEFDWTRRGCPATPPEAAMEWQRRRSDAELAMRRAEELFPWGTDERALLSEGGLNLSLVEKGKLLECLKIQGESLDELARRR